ncbi:MAG: trypsin-like peptidase domain-containing protein [Chloracidobacterium sp.]|nr:trypsin-like peptidase domain-containing protein [Chloracidobacterium sp.]
MEYKLNYSTKRARLARRTAPVLALLLGLFAPVFGQQAPQTQVSEKTTNATQTPSTAEFSRAFINAAKRIKPAVVHVKVGTKGATGSGVIVSSDGYILTNNHVASAANELTVKLSDGRELRARRIGVDQAADLALIKIEAQNLPYATLGDSSKLEQGEWVIALGSPFGLDQTMTAGIVSALGRKFNGPYDNFIQTDASINPGNSGGALVNMKGEVIGINTSILSRGGGSEGIGFAIPSNTAKMVKDRLLGNAGAYARASSSAKTGSTGSTGSAGSNTGAKAGANAPASRGYLGVSVQDQQDGEGGAVVAELTNGSPASAAGLRDGDVIVEFDGKTVRSSQQLAQFIASTPVGRPVKLKFVRDGQAQTASITLAERPRRPTA